MQLSPRKVILVAFARGVPGQCAGLTVRYYPALSSIHRSCRGNRHKPGSDGGPNNICKGERDGSSGRYVDYSEETEVFGQEEVGYPLQHS